MREVEAAEQQQMGRGQYAEDGSLAPESKKKEREKAMLDHAARSRGPDQR